MFRVCRHKITGRLIEAQSGEGDHQTLIDNNIPYYDVGDLEVIEVSDQEFKELMDALPEVVAAKVAREAREVAILDSLPSWSQVEAAIDNATTLLQMREIVKKMARVVYWLAKNTDE